MVSSRGLGDVYKRQGLDSWLSDDWKDVRITLKVVERRAAYSTATQVGVCVIDRLEAPDAGRIRFVCRSVFERLEKVISTTYPDTINNLANRGKPRPMTLGSVRWMDPVCSTLANSVGDAGATYDVADSCFEGITELRNRGGFQDAATQAPVSYTHLTLPTIHVECRSRWSPYH